MRILLSLVACGAFAAPALALAQTSPAPSLPTTEVAPAIVEAPFTPPTLTPLPTVEATRPADAPAVAAPPPTEEAGPAAPELAPPTTIAPVITAKEQKSGLGGQAGVMAVGVAAGAGGAAVAGPVGKFAAGFLGRTVARGLFGVGKEKTPELTVVHRDPQAEIAAAAAPATGVDTASATVPKETLVSDDR